MDTDVTTAGRHPGSDIFLDDVTVSRRHAEFRRDDGRFSIYDAGSLNGTYVNQRRVESTELANGDELQIGKFKLTFYTGE
jgi:pSer/pThr/pTyr-binding forkhead associated (FHA) protein